MKDDGTLDEAASLRKNADAYVALEKRLGSGDVPPPSAGEYQLNVPDAFKDSFQPEDPGFKEFLTNAHAAGMTQKQIDAAMSAFFAWAPKIAEGQQAIDHDACVKAMQGVWKDPAEFKAGFQGAARALQTFAGERFERIGARLGNDPDFVWLMAQVGAQIKEDTTPGGQTAGGADIKALELSEAYTNPRHPDHERVSATVRAHYERTYGAKS